MKLKLMVANPAKELHTVFSVPKDKIVALIDEAWALRSSPLASDPVVYIVDMKRIIGTDGEKFIRISESGN